MNKRLPILIAFCSALAWAQAASQQGASQSLSFQPGRSAFVACFKVNGEPDRAVESMVRKTFEKQKRFELAADPGAADFVFLVYTEYRTPFIAFAEIRSQDVDPRREFVYAMTGYVISPARLDQVKGNLDALCAEAIWYRQEKNRFNPQNSSWFLGRLVKKFHEDADKLGRGDQLDDKRPCACRNGSKCEETVPPKTTAAAAAGATTMDAKKLDQEAAKLNDDGEYEKAAKIAEQALSLRQSQSSSPGIEMIPTLNHLARALIGKGSYQEAETHLRRALGLTVPPEKANTPLTAEILNQLASLYLSKGDYDAAAPLYQQSLTIIEKALPADDIKHAGALNNLAALWLAQGETARAEPLLNRAREIAEKKARTNQSDAISILNNLAALHLARNDYIRAEALCQKALEINEGWRGTINRLMEVARPALKLEEGEWQNNSPRIGYPLNNLALIRLRQGRLAEANELLQRARRIQEYKLGVNHPALTQTFDNLALLARLGRKTHEAISWQRRSNEIRETNLRRNLIVGSERQKLSYLAQSSSRLDFTLSLHLSDAVTDPAACAVALTALLRHKGRGLDAQTDSIAELRRSVKEPDRSLFDRLLEARTRLANLIIVGESGLKSNELQTRQLEKEIEQLEEEIGQKSSGFRALTQAITPESIQRLIPADAALIEYARYRPVDEFNQPKSAPRYAVYVLTAKGAPQGMDLGEADAIDSLVDRVREALRDPKSTNYKVLARVLDERIMQPVRRLAGSSKSFLIAPQGKLNLLPFSALVDEDQIFLVNRYGFTYLTSGRDLLRMQNRTPSRQHSLIVADPDFGEREEHDARAALPNTSPFARTYFSPLPGTAVEAVELKALLPEATVLTRKEATETALKKAVAPDILHIATHGFFLEPPRREAVDPPPEASQRILLQQTPLSVPVSSSLSGSFADNPLLRSGLGLAGANLLPSGTEDGILTAWEVSALNWWGTKLVVLSACDTGVGEVRSGEGVYGLRRALVLAGAETLVMSLWPVSDQGTRDLMIAYYKSLQTGEGRSEAMRQVQIQMLADSQRQHPYYWAGFIVSGEWARLEGK
ncbi:MAG TPA: CHAT domain-containing tetratricopeptide repeat protein [Blastocatellia bacterium]|nr:CHAT domain-containing tetratricopeptide repeat protein [Blastocatellia bacterium]